MAEPLTPAPLSPDQVRDFIAETREALVPDVLGSPAVEVISKRAWRLVVRAPAPDGRPVIVKFWARHDLKGRLRRGLGLSAAAHESHGLALLARHAVPAPAIYGYAHLGAHGSGYTEGMVMEDLGAVTEAVAAIKRPIMNGDTAAEARFNDELIAMTAKMIQASILDYDHSMVNIAQIDATGRLVRLDLEQARQVRSLTLRERLYSRMLGRFLGSYVFAVQPDTDRAARFARALFDEINPPGGVLDRTQVEINRLLAQQTASGGPDTHFPLPR